MRWETALISSGLPLARTDAGRPRISFAAPLPTGIAGVAEMLETWLTERLAAWQVRQALDAALPPDHRLGDLENVWLGAAALPGLVSGAVYVVTLASGERSVIDAAARRILASATVPRERQKGGTTKAYDLRPLIAGIAVEPVGDGVALRLTTRMHPELGSGRPDEVIAALGDAAGRALDVREIVRERLLLGDG